MSTLLDATTSQQHLISCSDCLDELGRFRIWANTIGAFLEMPFETSLDYRLREAPKMIDRNLTALGRPFRGFR